MAFWRRSVPVLKLADLANMYLLKLEELGVETASRVNSTRFKERIFSAFPEMSAHSQGRDILLISNWDVGDAIQKAYEQDIDNQAMHLAKAAKIDSCKYDLKRSKFQETSI